MTSIRSTMKGRLMALEEKILSRKRSLIETVNDTLKKVCQIEHSRHRSPMNFLAHLVTGLIAYTRLPKKPSLKRNTPAKRKTLFACRLNHSSGFK